MKENKEVISDLLSRANDLLIDLGYATNHGAFGDWGNVIDDLVEIISVLLTDKENLSFECDGQNYLITSTTNGEGFNCRKRTWTIELKEKDFPPASKGELLTNNGFWYNYKRMLYVSSEKRKIFSWKIINKNSSKWLRDKIDRDNPTPDWKFYFLDDPPSDKLIEDICKELGT